jgi:hypothetical protein
MDCQRYWGVVYNERVSHGQTNERDEYHRFARKHLARRLSIEKAILKALRANVCTSYLSLSQIQVKATRGLPLLQQKI